MKTRKASYEKLNFIAYCGLYCPRCYKMKVADSAKRLLGDLADAQNKGAKISREAFEVTPILKKFIADSCEKFCRESDKKCAIKLCCIAHKTIGCWECSDFNSCKKLEPQFLVNNKKLREIGVEEDIKNYK